jgi:hypothetical protein
MSDFRKKYGLQPAASAITAKQNGGDRVVEVVEDDSRQPQAATDFRSKYGIGKKEAPAKGPRGGPVSLSGLPGRFWDELVSPPENNSAKAMFETMDAAGGYVRSGIAEAAKRLATLGQNGFDTKKAAAYAGNPLAMLLAGAGEGLGPETWRDVRHGKAPSMRQHLADAGMDGVGGAVTGFAADVITDPMNAMFAGVTKVKPTNISPWNALAQNAMQPIAPITSAVSAMRPVGNAIQNLGKRVFRMPFKNADARVALKFRGAEGKVGPHEYSNYLFNDGQYRTGGFRKTNQEIKADLKGLKQGSFERMRGETGDLPDIDLSPEFTRAREAAGKQAVADRTDEIFDMVGQRTDRKTKKAQKPAEPNQLATADDIDRLDTEALLKRQEAYRRAGEMLKDPAAKQYFEILARQAQDAFERTTKANLRRGVRGGKNQLEDTVSRLKEAMPELAGMIDENHARFASGDQEAALKFFDQIINDGLHGPRTAEDFQGLITTYGRNAAGSEPMKSSGFIETNRVNTKTANNMGVRKDLSEILEDKVMDAAEAAQGTLAGHEAVGRFKQAKRDYGLLARGEPEALKTLEQAEKAPMFSKLDALAAATIPFKPVVGLPWAAAKGFQMLNRLPRVGTGVGMLLNETGKSNIWDNMVRRGLLDQALREEQ